MATIAGIYLYILGTRNIYPLQLELYFTTLNIPQPKKRVLDNLAIFIHNTAFFRIAILLAGHYSGYYGSTGDVLKACRPHCIYKWYDVKFCIAHFIIARKCIPVINLLITCHNPTDRAVQALTLTPR